MGVYTTKTGKNAKSIDNAIQRIRKKITESTDS